LRSHLIHAGDDSANDVVGQDHIAAFLRVRDRCEPASPRILIGYAAIESSRKIEARLHGAARPVHTERDQVLKQTVPPLRYEADLKARGGSPKNATRGAGQSTRCACAKSVSVLVARELRARDRLGDHNRRCSVNLSVTTRKLAGCIDRLMICEDGSGRRRSRSRLRWRTP
jgi:hypothetical protein